MIFIPSRPKDFASFWEVIPVTTVPRIMGTIIIFMQLSQISPMNLRLFIGFPIKMPAAAPASMDKKIIVDNENLIFFFSDIKSFSYNF
jgi:hypothetical protein